MLHDVISATVLPDYRLRLCFDDGQEGVVDLSEIVGTPGVFAPLRAPTFFARVVVNPEVGTVVWPNGADLCPDVLYRESVGGKCGAGETRATSDGNQ